MLSDYQTRLCQIKPQVQKDTMKPPIYESLAYLAMKQPKQSLNFLFVCVCVGGECRYFSVFKHFYCSINSFTMSCSFLLHSKVNQLFIYPFLFRFISHLGHYIEQFPVLYSRSLVVMFYIQQFLNEFRIWGNKGLDCVCDTETKFIYLFKDTSHQQEMKSFEE